MRQLPARTLRVGLAQFNSCVGDLPGNTAKIIHYIARARRMGVDILCFPELAVTGYPPEDLLMKSSFIHDNLEALESITGASRGLTVILGFVDKKDDIYNAAAVIHDGELVDVYYKQFLPNYGVFDENRYFQAGRRSPVYELGGVKFGVNVCEDIWYPGGPARDQALLGNAEIIFNISSSPYHQSKIEARERMLCTRARDYSTIIVFTNTVGGQDELVFDGNSVVINARGEVVARAASFEEELLVAEINPRRVFRARLHDPRRRKDRDSLATEHADIAPIPLRTLPDRTSLNEAVQNKITPFLDPLEEVWKALVLGTRDYTYKNGFDKVVIGMSGGIDSSLVAAIAAEALGPENIKGVTMPSHYSSEGSVKDSVLQCRRIGIDLLQIPIHGAVDSYTEILAPVFKHRKPDITEENIQARIRGNILMALSNKFGWLVLTTANKSETSVGYSTLYGDMAGGFAIIKDVPKTLVYKLAEYYNTLKGKHMIPKGVITKPPSAELSPGQKDTDSLPPYTELDPLLRAYIEDDLGLEGMAELGFPDEVVDRIVRLVDKNEYKRRQAPPGIKITGRAFGKDRRFPITNRYRG